MTNWLKKDLKYNWHPYTQTKDHKSFPPVLIEKAKGIKLYDNKGNFYYDTISSWWCNIHGHNHPKIKKAIHNELSRLDHVLFAGFTHKKAILLAEKLISITPKNLKRVFFSDNGSTAVETAVKMSFQYWHNKGYKDKTKFVSLDSGYHGDTIGAMSLSGVSLFNSIFKPLLFKGFTVPAPYCYRCPGSKKYPRCKIECAQFLENVLKKNHNKIAAIILEPMVMAAGGMIIYPKEYLKKAATLAKKYNIHMIVDEVATGFGRTGKMFAIEHACISPDFMCLSKGLTAGYLPMAATLTTEKIYSSFYGDDDKKKTFFHGHTFTANPVAAAAALASIDIFKKESTFKKIKKLIPVFHKSLEKFKTLPLVGDVRYLGMIGAIELVKDKNTKEPFNVRKETGLEVYKESLKRKIILRPLGNVIYLYLPLSINLKEIKFVLNETFQLIRDIKSRI